MPRRTRLLGENVQTLARVETIHAFLGGNENTGRALALCGRYPRGFDTHHIFSVDEYYWEDRQRCYAAPGAVRTEGEDLTAWLEYAAEGLQITVKRVWARVQLLSARSGREKLVLRPKQEQLLQLLRERKSTTPQAAWDASALPYREHSSLCNRCWTLGGTTWARLDMTTHKTDCPDLKQELLATEVLAYDASALDRDIVATAQTARDNLNRPHTREAAAFPAKSLHDYKFWTAIARVDNVFGERNPVCSCVGMENYS